MRTIKLLTKRTRVKQTRYCPYLKRFVEGQPSADKNEYHSTITK